MGQGDSVAPLLTLLDLYIHTFSAHLHAYVKDSHFTVKEPLTPEVALAAFGVGGFSVSGYLAVEHDGNWVTQVGAIDFDTDEGLAQGADVQATLAPMGIPSILVESRRGSHLWVLCQKVIPASVMTRALGNALALCSLPTDHIEVFPKRSTNAFGVGALRMPLMRHPKTGKVYPVHADGLIVKVLDLMLLAASSESPENALRSLAGPEADTGHYPRLRGPYVMRPRRRDEAPSAVELLDAMGVSAAPGRSVRCPFHEDQHASLSVSPDDQRVWCHAPACPIHNDGRGLGTFSLENHIRKESPGVLQGTTDSKRVFDRLPR